MTNVASAGKTIVAGSAKGSLKKKAVKKGTGKKINSKKASATVAGKSSVKRKHNYLTKRILVSAAKTGFAKASKRTMKVMGKNVIVKDGWVVRIFADGHIERISKLESNNNNHLALD